MYKSEVLANLALGGLLCAILARPETITQGLSDCSALVQASIYYFGEYANLQHAIKVRVREAEREFEETRMDLPRWSETSWGEEVGPVLYRALFSEAALLPPKEFLQKFRGNIERLTGMVESMAFDKLDSDTMSILKTKLNEFGHLEEEIHGARKTFCETKQNLSAWADSIFIEESVGSLWLAVTYPKEEHLSPDEFSLKFNDNIDQYMVTTGECNQRSSANLPSELENPSKTKKMFKEKAMELQRLSANIIKAKIRYVELFTNLPEWAESSFGDLLGAILLIAVRRFLIISNQDLFGEDMLRSNGGADIHQIISALVTKAEEFEAEVEELEDHKNLLVQYKEMMARYKTYRDQTMGRVKSDEFWQRIKSFWLPLVTFIISSAFAMVEHHKADDTNGEGGELRMGKPQDKDDSPVCIICQDRVPNVALAPCGHQNLCMHCASLWRRRRSVGGGAEVGGECPTCRRKIKRIQPLIPL